MGVGYCKKKWAHPSDNSILSFHENSPWWRLPTPARKYNKWNQGLVALVGTTLLVTIAAFLGLKFTNRHKQV